MSRTQASLPQAEAATFVKGRRFTVRSGAGDELATIVRPQRGDPLYPVWQAVRFDDGSRVMVHASGLVAL